MGGGAAPTRKPKRQTYLVRIATALLCAALYASAAAACSVCFGDPDNPQSHGLNQAIFTLLGVLGAVMTTIVIFATRIALRIRRAEIAAAAGPGDAK